MRDRSFLAVVAAAIVALLILAFAAGTAQAADVCPEEGKVESVVDGDIDGIVLDAGTQVCIKGGQDLVVVTADGEATLAELLGNGKNVSHYTALEVPPSTTTTTVPPTTTTSVVETTTTTESSTTTTTPPASSTTTPATSSTTTETTPPTTQTELPYTGIEDWLWLVGAGLLGLGATAVMSVRDLDKSN